MSDLTLLASNTTTSPPEGIVGLLCEVAPDGSLAHRFPDAVQLRELVGDFEPTKTRAHVLARKLLANEPPLRGVRQLKVFEEALIRELQRTFHVLNMLDWITIHGCSTCRVEGESWISEKLTTLAAKKHVGLDISVATRSLSLPIQRVSRVLSRISQSRYSRAGIWQELRQVLELWDPFHTNLLRPARREDWEAKEIWFYTTARTFTQIGLAYEPYFPSPFRFLVENPATGGAPLAEAGRSFMSVYEFGSADFSPVERETDDAFGAIERHVAAVPLSGDECLVRDAILGGSFLGEFKRRLLPKALFFTSLFDRWAERTSPQALVVGNPGFEGLALQAARRHGIPTILLQHGILGDYCQFVDPPVDSYIVRGNFWREFLAGEPRGRSRVLNIPGDRMPVGPQSPTGREILFLTTPFQMHAFQTADDVRDILRTLMSCAQSSGRELIVRVHPLEKVGLYRKYVAETVEREGIEAPVTFSQGAGLEDAIRRAAVAVTYSSTAFLDCLRIGVPIVSFAWHDFSYQRQIEDRCIFNFAHTLEELKATVLAAIGGNLPSFAGDASDLMAGTKVDELRNALAELVAGTSDRRAVEMEQA